MSPSADGGDRRVVEVKARTVDEAVARGLVRLGGLSRSEVKIEVLQEPKAGLLGFGSSEAEVRLTTLLPGEEPGDVASGPVGKAGDRTEKGESAGTKSDTPSARRRSEPPRRGESGVSRRKDGEPAESPPAAKAEEPVADTESGSGRPRGRTPRPPRSQASRPGSAQAPTDRPAAGPRPAPTSRPFEGGEGEPARVVPPDEAEAVALEVTRGLVGLLGFEGAVVVRGESFLSPDVADDQSLVIGVTGGGTRRLLSFDAAGLNSLQFLVRLILARRLDGWVNLLLDVEGDRARRVQELTQLASQSAELVEREGRPVSFPPMSGYERRIVHLLLKDHPGIATQSIGSGENRKVTVRRMDQLLPDL